MTRDSEHRYFIGGRQIPGVTNVLRPYGAFTGRQISDRYAQRGSRVHRITELFDLGQLNESSLDELGQQYLRTWKSFLLDTQLSINLIEYMDYSRIYAYAGQLDRQATVIRKGKEVQVLIDIKTGIPDRTAGPQMAAYANLIRENLDVPTNERWVVHLTPEKYTIYPYREALDFKRFCAALTLHTWR